MIYASNCQKKTDLIIVSSIMSLKDIRNPNFWYMLPPYIFMFIYIYIYNTCANLMFFLLMRQSSD